MTPRVVGLDLSLTATGIADASGGSCTVGNKLRGCERMEWIRDQVMAACPIEPAPSGWPMEAPLVVIEDFAFAAKGRAIFDIGGLGWVIRMALHENGIPYALVSPTALKKYATGKGNANKDAMRDAARDRFGMVAGVTSDECDAAWLRAMGLDHLGHPPVAMPAVNRAALAKVAWPT